MADTQNYGTASVVQWFNKRSVESTGCLCAALITAIIMLATGSIHVFTRPDAPQSYQRDVVLSSYFYWMKVSLVLTVFLTVLGIIFFFQCIKFLVYIKFTDQVVAFSGKSHSWLGASADNTYGYVVDMLWFLIYIPVAVICMIASKVRCPLVTALLG